MCAQTAVRDSARLPYYLMCKTISFAGVALITASAVTLIAFWICDFILPGHPYVGILIFLLLPAVFILGLLLPGGNSR
jgi:hypothetical protein